MKMQLFLIIISFLLGVEASGQYWYSKYYGNKELAELNSEELSLLYEKSNSAANSGLILTVAGSAAAFSGVYVMYVRMLKDIAEWDYSGDTVYNLSALAAIGGTVMAAVGISTLVIGSQRKRTIRNVINSQKTSPMVQIMPSFQYDHSLHGCSSGLTLFITF
jgi:hypothetical protein